MRRLFLIVLAVSGSGCLLYFDDHGKSCPIVDVAEAAPLLLRNPDTLTCDAVGGGECDPDCGPCPATTDLAPIPTWGQCNSSCDALDESACSDRLDCRIVRD